MKKQLLLSLMVVLNITLFAKDAVSEGFKKYREIALKASTDPYYFSNFRALDEYQFVTEIHDGNQFAEYVKATPKLLGSKENFRRLDQIGNPKLIDYPGLGKFSPTNLRYIVLADQIVKMCRLPKDASIVEIGAGFGGQAYALSQVTSFSKYYIYDLPEAEALINKVSEELKMSNVLCLPTRRYLPVEKIDLVISNYAFSEMGRKKQLEYFDKVIRKADRGFILYNQISGAYGVDSMKPSEFVSLLKANGFRPKVKKEYPCRCADNLLITWSKV